MATTMSHEEASVGSKSGGREQVWRAIAKASFAIVSYVTPTGEPRSSGVMYATVGRRLYVVVGPESWKAKHVAASGRVAVTVPVRRGGLLSLALPIPPATISFHGAAIVHPPGSPRLAPSRSSWRPCSRPIGGPRHASSRSARRGSSSRTPWACR